MIFGNEIVFKIIINTIFVSIPEEVFFVLFTYVLMGEFDQWKDEDCKKLFQPWDYARILVPAVSAALISNILRYTGAGEGFISSGTLLVLIIGIVAMGDIFNNARVAKWIGEVILFIFLAAICAAIMELAFIPFVVYGINKPLAEINNNMLSNFLLTIPLKIMQYSLLAYMIARKRSLLRARIIKMITENRVLLVIILIALFTDVSFLVFMNKLVCYDNVLTSLSIMLRLVTIICICLFPILNLLAIVWCTYLVKNNEAINKKEASDKIKNVVAQINSYMESGDYVNVKWTLNGFKANLEEVANGLYFDRKK